MMKVGRTKHFTVPIKGYPAPDASLLHDGIELKPPSNVRAVRSEPREVQIVAENVQRSDSGNYELALKNPLAELRLPFEMRVYGPPGKPGLFKLPT